MTSFTRPPINVPAFVEEIETIIRFVPPDTEVDRLLVQAVTAVKKFRGRAIIKRPGVMRSLNAALQLAIDPTVKRELTALIARLNEPSRRVR